MAAMIWFPNLPSWAKRLGIALTGGLLIGSATFLFLQASGYGASSQSPRLNKRKGEDGKRRIENGTSSELVRRVLVLGLSGAGKSSLLSRLTKISKLSTSQSSNSVKPTDGFSVISLQMDNRGTLNIWEVGGADKNRAYWENFLSDTNLLVYVVDSADDNERLKLAVAEFKKLIVDARLNNVPILLLANKQDSPRCKNQFEIEKLFGCEGGFVDGHRVRVLGTRAPPNLPSHPTVGEAERLLITMSAKK